MSVIHLKDVRFSWVAESLVLDIPELVIHPGEKVFIHGPSGSGKTTLLGLLGGVLTPSSGTVEVLDDDISRLSPIQRDHFRARHVGFIFQMFNLIPYLSVVENVTLPLGFASERAQAVQRSGVSPEAEAMRLLALLGLSDPELLKRPVTELSIGQQQRVAAARALIGSPDIIIADEPTSALDFDSREAFIRLLFSECEATGSTLVFVSHDHSLEALFDRCLPLHRVNRASQHSASSTGEVA
ncbi:ABC transporter ATP-binding protein [uncultured Endozoicomonas sp.]|uniref:ABC transporter ATP-binding protein n=1 Tax=uncultured Endozoicomonas sp. TaxID=432652 RepID=UPI00262E35DF|nr:ABC transporter ATP-binding protein [uncultured Endozoicomonas sp.]